MAKKTSMKAWEKSPAGKADDKQDKKRGIKENSAQDKKIDRAKMFGKK